MDTNKKEEREKGKEERVPCSMFPLRYGKK